MLEWAKANYSGDQVQKRAFITTLDYCGSVGRYHIYQMINGQYVVIFDDQRALLNYVELNLGSIFLVRFLHCDNNKYSYTVELDGREITVLTLARAVVIVQGSEEDPRKLYLNTDELITIE
jgi:hypothetical protein